MRLEYLLNMLYTLNKDIIIAHGTCVCIDFIHLDFNKFLYEKL